MTPPTNTAATSARRAATFAGSDARNRRPWEGVAPWLLAAWVAVCTGSYFHAMLAGYWQERQAIAAAKRAAAPVIRGMTPESAVDPIAAAASDARRVRDHSGHPTPQAVLLNRKRVERE